MYLFISQLAHDYDNKSFDEFMDTHYKCHGIYKRYLLAYKGYITHKETGIKTNIKIYKGKFILEPKLHWEYFKLKNKKALDNIEVIPELYNHGFIFTSVQESVKQF